MDPSPAMTRSTSSGSTSPSDGRSSPTVSRTAAVAMLRRAASTRDSPDSTSPRSRSRNASPAGSPHLVPPTAQASGRLPSRSPSPSHRHTASADTTSLAGPGATSLERTASLLARQMAMAKLTGSAPPTPPALFYKPTLPGSAGSSYVPTEPLPSLDELRERARARATADSPSTSTSTPPLRRNHTVTGVGGAARVGDPSSDDSNLDSAWASSTRDVASTPAEEDSVTDDVPTERAEARVNLIRKLSSRRPERSGSSRETSPTASRRRVRDGSGATSSDPSSPTLSRTGTGVGDEILTSSDGGVPEVPSVPQMHATGESMQNRSPCTADDERTGEELAVPLNHLHDVEEQTPRQGDSDNLGRFQTPRPLDAHTFPSRQFPYNALESSQSSAAYPTSSSDAMAQSYDPSQFEDAQPVLAIRRGSIPQHVYDSSGAYAAHPRVPAAHAHSPSAIATTGLGVSAADSVRAAAPLPSFGIRAVEEPTDDIRRRGSSASSSVAFLGTRTDRSFSGAAGTTSGRGTSTGGMIGGGGGGRSSFDSASHGGSGSASGASRLADFLSNRSDSLSSSSGGLGLSTGLGLGSHVMPGGAPGAHGAGQPDGLSRSGSSLGDSTEHMRRAFGSFTDDEEGHAQLTESDEQTEDIADAELRMQELRLAAKVERKREAAKTRSKAGAFPPPEENYQFPPSPSAAQDDNSDSARFKGRRGLDDVVRPSPFLPSYAPLPVAQSRATPTNISLEPLSPTSTVPPDSRLLGPAPAAPVPVSHSMDRGASTDSAKHRRWLQATMFADGNVSPRTSPLQPLAGASPDTAKMGISPQSDWHSAPEEHSPNAAGGDSVYSSATEMKRDHSGSSFNSFFPLAARHEQLPFEELPAHRILAKLDSLLGDDVDHAVPSPLDQPVRKLILHAPMLQVVNANTVKDRYLFLFSDLLLITKPIIFDDATGSPVPPTLDTSFVVKSAVELRQIKVVAAQEPTGEPSSSSKRKSQSGFAAFVDRFANDPKKAIGNLLQRGGMPNDAGAIAQMLFKNPELNRNQVGAYLCMPENRHILRAYIERFRLAGVRLDDALRMLLMTLRLPHNIEACDYFLGVFAQQWTELNGASGFDPSLTHTLVTAIMRLSDALHSAQYGDSLFAKPNPDLSVDEWIARFRELDTRFLVPEDMLNRIYDSVRRDRVELGSDNSIFSMTPDIEATVSPARLPDALTYRSPSQTITITIPEPDSKFWIKLHGNDLKFEPAVLTFAKHASQTFKVTGMALGFRVMVLIKGGANAPRYQGLPLNKTFSIERAFMQHTFQVSFTNHLSVKRKYMFSTLDASVRATWLKAIRERTSICLKTPPPADPSQAAGEAIAVQVLRDSLIQPEDVIAPSSAAPSPRPNTSAPRFGAGSSSLGVPPRTTRSRLGTPTRPSAGALIRSNSFSKLYAHNYKFEIDNPLEKKAGQAGAVARRGSRDDTAALQALQTSQWSKTGHEIVVTTEQNSLLPTVLSFLSSGLPAAPLPMSSQGSAFQLPPHPPRSGDPFSNISFISSSKQSV